jgi:hypothetical protein
MSKQSRKSIPGSGAGENIHFWGAGRESPKGDAKKHGKDDFMLVTGHPWAPTSTVFGHD